MRSLNAFILPTAFLVSLHGLASGQIVREVTDADLQRAARSQPVITDKDLERAARVNRAPTDAEVNAAQFSTPNVDALPTPKGMKDVDLAEIAKGFDQLGKTGKPPSSFNDKRAVLVFVSFSMPEKTLQRLASQAARTDAIILIRGFDSGSLKKTLARIKRMIGNNKVSVQIDPQAFDRFSIARAPTFVLVKPGALPVPCAAGTCVPPANFVSASGDVSVDYALEFFQRSSPSFAKDAGELLAKYRRTQ